MEKKQLLRKLPKVDELLKEEIIKSELESTTRILVIDALRSSIENYRELILNDSIGDFTKEDILNNFKDIIQESKGTNFKKVINAAGVANDEVIMDLRTMFDKDFDIVVDTFARLDDHR